MKRLLKTIPSLLIMVLAMSASIFAKGWTTDGIDWFYYDSEDQLLRDTIKSSGDDKYYLDENGFMVRDYLLEGYNDYVYYFDDSGKMVRNTWVAVDTAQVENQMDNAPSIYLYYFGPSGKAYQGSSNRPAKKTIDGKKYLFNENGQMLSGWINQSGERYNIENFEEDPFVGYCYYAGDETDGVLREGWSSYEDGSVDDKYYTKETLWFYFKPGDCKKECSTTENDYKLRTINGRKYGFDINGVMIQGWESDTIPTYGDTVKYFSEEEGDELGRMYKKEWIFAVPSALQAENDNTDIHGAAKNATNDHDEEIQRWFYALGSGDIVKGMMKKINTEYYVFNKVGIMKHGLCVIEKGTNKFVDCIDLEKTDGKDFIMSRHYVSMESYNASDEYAMFDDKTQRLFYFETDEMSEDYGKRKLRDRTVAFADNDYTFTSTNTGENEGLKSKKYYQAGILLKAEPTIGYGLVFIGYASSSTATGAKYKPSYNTNLVDSPAAHEDVNHPGIYTDYIVDTDGAFCKSAGRFPVFQVVDAYGKKLKNSNTYKKDKAGHYWLIGPSSSLLKIFDVPIKYTKSTNNWYFKSDVLKGNRITTDWIPFADSPGLANLGTPSEVRVKDEYGKSCYLGRLNNDGNPIDPNTTYETYIDDVYATNFRFKD